MELITEAEDIEQTLQMQVFFCPIRISIPVNGLHKLPDTFFSILKDFAFRLIEPFVDSLTEAAFL
jgi:hypothetical protein